MSEYTPTAMPVHECTPTMLMYTTSDGALPLPRPAMSLHAMHECTPAMPKPTWPVNEHTLTTPRPTLPGLAECTHTVSMPAPTVPGLVQCTPTVSTPGLARPTTSGSTVVSQPAVPGPTLPQAKPQPHTSSLVIHSSTPPASEVTQPQMVLIKQFQ